MLEQQKKYKAPPKKFHPRGITILYEDRDILVVEKQGGLLTVGNEKTKENTAYYLLNQYVRKGNQKSRNRVFIVHRLDRDTSGVLVFAKNDKTKRFLQEQWQDFSKKYSVVVHGKIRDKKGVIESYLAENSVHKMYSTSDHQNGKLSKTAYTVVKESAKYSLIDVNLLTGRKNQIRVHFSEKGSPVAGDKMYGKKDKGIKRLALHAAALTLLHPATKEKMTFETKIPGYFESLVNS